jgi:acetyl-CoA carboxylase biotin carboxyl carrier protein
METEQRLADLEGLIDEFKRSGLRELQARHGDFEIYLSQDKDAPGLAGGGAPVVPVQRGASGVAAPVPMSSPAATSAGAVQDVPEGAVIVCAPYLGTFYRSPKPGLPPYVEIGSDVSTESELCLVEVMKLFTAVRAGVAGKVVQVMASDGELVAADQPLFAVLPA